MHLCNGTLPSNEKEQITNTCNNLDESQKPCAEWNKPVSEGYTAMIEVSIYKIFSNNIL